MKSFFHCFSCHRKVKHSVQIYDLEVFSKNVAVFKLYVVNYLLKRRKIRCCTDVPHRKQVVFVLTKKLEHLWKSNMDACIMDSYMEILTMCFALRFTWDGVNTNRFYGQVGKGMS